VLVNLLGHVEKGAHMTESHQLKRSEATLKPSEALNVIHSTKTFRDRCIIECLYFGGMRVQEVDNEHLFVGNLDFQRCVIHVRKSKFDKTRTVPFMDANFMADLRQLVRGRKPPEPVVNVKRRMIQHIVQHAAEAAGITNPYTGAKHVSPHVFRHSIARHLKSAGYAAEFIQKFLGHQSITTTMDTYGTLSLGEMQQIIANKTGDTSLIGDAKSIRPEIQRM
jgi:integrase/recombinase XerD